MALTMTQIGRRFCGGRPSPQDELMMFCRRDVVLRADGRFPTAAEAASLLPAEGEYLQAGERNGVYCYGLELGSLPGELPEGFQLYPARAVLADGEGEMWQVLSRARELLFWRRQHRFCGGCGERLEPSESDSALICPRCGQRYYPQIAPAVIVAVTRDHGRELLLAHNRSFEPGVFGLLAGFVESGETVEQAAEREIREEVGIGIRGLRYLGSQAWPFPNSLMLALTAEYGEGELFPDGVELTEAGWFPVDALPKLPPHGSIARQVINTVTKK